MSKFKAGVIVSTTVTRSASGYYIDPTGEYEFIRLHKGRDEVISAVLQVGKRFMYVPIESCTLVDLTKPDDYVYPDTPKGTELVVVQNLLSVHIGNTLPKGLEVTLEKRCDDWVLCKLGDATYAFHIDDVRIKV